MLTARKIAQIGTSPRWWCGIGPAGAIGGAAVPYLGRRRRRIGFSSRTLPTDGAEILRRWWLAGLVHATARWLAGKRKRCPVPSGYMCIYSVLLETATHLVLVFRFVIFSISANPPVLLPFFSSTNKQQADAVPSAALPLPTVPARSPRSLVPLSTFR